MSYFPIILSFFERLIPYDNPMTSYSSYLYATYKATPNRWLYYSKLNKSLLYLHISWKTVSGVTHYF